jgi:hypothetical protein
MGCQLLIANPAQNIKDNEIAKTILAFLSLAGALRGGIGGIFGEALREALGMALKIIEGIMGITGLIFDIKGKPDIIRLWRPSCSRPAMPQRYRKNWYGKFPVTKYGR